MLSTNCRLILDLILSKGESEKYMSHKISTISKEIDLPSKAVLSACLELEHDDFAVIGRINAYKSPSMPVTIKLTEKGICYKTLLMTERIDYIKDKWIDFLALTISIIALIKSFWPEISVLLQK